MINIHKNKGFSFIELLIVFFIIVTLNSFIFSIFSHFINKALIINCKHNLHQLGIAFLLYAQDNNFILPHSDRDSDTGPNHCWFDLLDKYIDEHFSPIKQCPAWKGYTNNSPTPDEHSIKMNGGLCPKERLPETYEDKRNHKWYWPRLFDIKYKSKTVLLLDGRMDSPYNTFTDTHIYSPYLDIANRHNDGANILFVDGGCKYIKPPSDIILGPYGWDTPYNCIWNPYKK